MSGIEILGIAASVIQIADAGARLSSKLFVFTRKVKNADRSIQDISREIAATGAALRGLGEALEQDKYATLGSRHSFHQTTQIVADCWEAFTEINETIGGEKLVKGEDATNEKVSNAIAKFKQPSLSFKQRFKFPFKEPQINMLRSKLESLKSSLMLMLQVLLLAEQVRNRPKAPVSEEQKDLIKTLVDEKNVRDLDFKRSYMAIEAAPSEKLELNTADTDDSSTLIGITPSETLAERPYIDTTEPTADCVARSISTIQTHVSLPSNPPASEGSATSRPPMKWASSRSSVKSGSEMLGSYSAEITVPASLRVRDEEIQHHAMLVHNLLEEISDVQYRLDHGIRHRMHDGILKIHWDEWMPFASKHGHNHFHRVFEPHRHVARYWLDLHEGVRPAPVTAMLPKKKVMIHFKDALEREFDIPFEQCQQWSDMMNLITHMFEHDYSLKGSVLSGNYDLRTEDRRIILPRLWDATIEPGMTVVMEMQPLKHFLPRPPPPPTRPLLRTSGYTLPSHTHQLGLPLGLSTPPPPRIPLRSSKVRRHSARASEPMKAKESSEKSSEDSDDGLFGLPLESSGTPVNKPVDRLNTEHSTPDVMPSTLASESLQLTSPPRAADSSPYEMLSYNTQRLDDRINAESRGPAFGDDHSNGSGHCFHPGCGRVFRDLKAHMLTHRAERPQKCPISSCEYHEKGFARKYDKNRHALTHFDGMLACGFCPGAGTKAEKSYTRVDVFKRHLTSMHGVQYVPPNSRGTLRSNKSAQRRVRCPSLSCNEWFLGAQAVYAHLDDCILNKVTMMSKTNTAEHMPEQHSIKAPVQRRSPPRRPQSADALPQKHPLYATNGSRCLQTEVALATESIDVLKGNASLEGDATPLTEMRRMSFDSADELEGTLEERPQRRRGLFETGFEVHSSMGRAELLRKIEKPENRRALPQSKALVRVADMMRWDDEKKAGIEAPSVKAAYPHTMIQLPVFGSRTVPTGGRDLSPGNSGDVDAAVAAALSAMAPEYREERSWAGSPRRLHARAKEDEGQRSEYDQDDDSDDEYMPFDARAFGGGYDGKMTYGSPGEPGQDEKKAKDEEVLNEPKSQQQRVSKQRGSEAEANHPREFIGKEIEPAKREVRASKGSIKLTLRRTGSTSEQRDSSVSSPESSYELPGSEQWSTAQVYSSGGSRGLRDGKYFPPPQPREDAYQGANSIDRHDYSSSAQSAGRIPVERAASVKAHGPVINVVNMRYNTLIDRHPMMPTMEPEKLHEHGMNPQPTTISGARPGGYREDSTMAASTAGDVGHLLTRNREQEVDEDESVEVYDTVIRSANARWHKGISSPGMLSDTMSLGSESSSVSEVGAETARREARRARLWLDEEYLDDLESGEAQDKGPEGRRNGYAAPTAEEEEVIEVRPALAVHELGTVNDSDDVIGEEGKGAGYELLDLLATYTTLTIDEIAGVDSGVTGNQEQTQR